MKEQYLTQNDVEFARKVLETAKGNNQFAKKEDGNTSGTEATETVVVPDEKPVKEKATVRCLSVVMNYFYVFVLPLKKGPSIVF